MHRLLPLEKDYYLDHEDVLDGGCRSDEEDDSGSSEDELQREFANIAGVLLPSQKRKQRRYERSFEADMERELDSSFREHNASWFTGRPNDTNTSRQKRPVDNGSSVKHPPSSTGESKSSDEEKTSKKPEEDVDPVLGLNDQGTESDEEFERTEGLGGSGEKMDDDNLLYDPEEDEANQNWIDTHRRSYQPQTSDIRPLPKSDAVLNCPGCMTILCLDCQRHEIYKTQYRAMFVMNCDVKHDELLYHPKSKRRGGAKKRQGDPEFHLKSGERFQAGDHDEMIQKLKRTSRPEDMFYPVSCSICKTEVGVFDSDEVYHFFNILASYA